eukprot:NODE_50_length_31184_cov_0.705099.p27 type:complete len:140 gc:universal NODE_50_length_31184_cov_0.705099:28105-27686(-)
MENLLSPQYASNPFKKQVFEPKAHSNKDLLVFEQRILMNRRTLYSLAFKNISIILFILFLSILIWKYLLLAAIAYLFYSYWQLRQAFFFIYTVNKSLRPFSLQFMKIGKNFEMVFDDCVPTEFRNNYYEYRRIWRNRKH